MRVNTVKGQHDEEIPTNARGQRSLAQGRLKDKIIKDSWKATQRRHGRN